MASIIADINQAQKKAQIVAVRSGDTVKVYQTIKEGNKERVQIFQGLVIRTSKQGGHLNRITVRRIASGVGVEKSFLLHSPLVVKVEVTKRTKVSRNYLTYMRQRVGKSARLNSVDFDKKQVNEISTLTSEPAKEETTTAA